MSKPPQKPTALPALDANGTPIVAGDRVLIREIPHWLIHDLLDEDIAHLRTLTGTVPRIRRFDEYGYAWFGDDPVGWFCLRPEGLERMTASASGLTSTPTRRDEAWQSV